MEKPLKPLVRKGGYTSSKRMIPLVYNGGFTTKNAQTEDTDDANTSELESNTTNTEGD